MKIILLLFLFSISLHAQVWTLKLTATNDEINAISAPDENQCWVVTTQRKLYKTMDAGSTWTQETLTINPAGVFSVNQYLGFISTSGVYRTTNGGETWSTVFSGAANSSSTVIMKDETTGLLVGQKSGDPEIKLYKSTNGGVTWSLNDVSQPPLQLTDGHGKGNIVNYGDEVWITQYQGGVSYSPDFGETWITPENNGFHITTQQDSSISFDGEIGFARSFNKLEYFLTTDGGNNWQVVFNNSDPTQDVLTFQGQLWLISNPADNFFVYHSANLGSTWEQQLHANGNMGFTTLNKSRIGGRLWVGSQNGDVHTSEQVMATNNVERQKTIIYPNPVNDILNINSVENILEISIFDLTGKKVKSLKNINQKDTKINLSDLPNGVYLMKIKTKNSENSVKVMVK